MWKPSSQTLRSHYNTIHLLLLSTSLSSFLWNTAYSFSLTRHNIIPHHHHRHHQKTPRRQRRQRQQRSSPLYGISEWRDTFFDIPKDSRAFRGVEEDDDSLPRRVCILPFPFEDVLLQGETKQLRLYEDRFIKLFDKCINEHSSVLAMGLIASSGIIQTAPLCEIEAYNRMDAGLAPDGSPLDDDGGNGLGVFVTIRVVGRVALSELAMQEPYIEAICREVRDESVTGGDGVLATMVAGNIENFMVTLSSLERRLYGEEEEVIDDDEGDEDDDYYLKGIKDDDMKRWIMEAERDEIYNNGDDDDGYPDRNEQFKNAYLQARNTDTQGYMISPTIDESTSGQQRDVRDLTAISWAAFCTDDMDERYRIQALDCDNLFDRLKFGSYVLREKKAELEAKLALSEIQTTEDDYE